MKNHYRTLLIFLLIYTNLSAQQHDVKDFVITHHGKAVPLYVNSKDYTGVKIAASNLQNDIMLVSDVKPEIINALPTKIKTSVIIAGTIGSNDFIDKLIKSKKLDVSDVTGKWETYVIQVIEKPFKGVDRALVIAGSDKRGTIFGIYEISKQIGVSPWHWWADVTPVKNQNISISATRQYSNEPLVKYRGIFINDEQPALGGWVSENYGGFNSKFYTKVFDLILRLKGNFLWPAMWGQSFYTEDSLNPKLADEYGVVISTSHHEPMMRAHVEWQRYNKGKWNYSTNEVALREFWREGIKRMGNYESVVTLAMRGDGDEPMSEDSNIALLQKIVADQRTILEEVTKRKANEIPQVWALYKEVQDYYDKGMRVPDDVTLLLCDDNWGNIRKLPQVGEKPRAGGYGIYYHFDYVGGPRNYKWINTNAIERIWEQMHLAYEHKATQLWIVNVGDIKPMEFPISFFLDYAWNPDAIKADELFNYTEKWCEQQFGNIHANEIASLLLKYSKYNARVKPELLNEKTYSLENYNEYETVVKAYQQLRTKAEGLANKLETSKQEAYYQLILHPITASCNLYELYYHVALNHEAAARNDAEANVYADKAKDFFKKDSLITLEYHKRNNGKWNHMMSQTHIGYTYWQQPPVNKMPEVKYISTSSTQTILRKLPSIDASSLVPTSTTKNIFIERDRYVSIDASHYTQAINSNDVSWQVLPNHGKTGSAITVFPVTAPEQTLSATSPHLEYEFYSYSEGTTTLQLYFSPTLNFHHRKEGLQYAVSIDDEQPQVFSLNNEAVDSRQWNNWVAQNIIIKSSTHNITKPGKHSIKFWLIHAGPVLQKLVLDFGGVKESYLGPPESKFEH
jgi:hypothetical protein